MAEAIQPREFFISRAGNDKDIARAIAKIIRDAGHTTWLQDEDFGHASFMARMEEGFEMNARVIALLSPDYQNSDYCRKEYNVALLGDPLNLKQRLIVMRVADCVPTGNLRDIAYIDLVPILGNAGHLTRLLHSAIGSQPQETDVEFANFYRRAPQQILHREIDKVPGFTGREAELAALQRALWKGGGTAALTNAGAASAAMRGLGGVGKSVLAQEYAWRTRERYCGVWWLRAEKRETLLDDLIELGARLIPGIKELPEREQAARTTLDFLGQTGFEKPWLIIYDNVEQPGDIAQLTPRMSAHILITTRWSDWYGQAAELPVDVFTPEAAVEFLLEHARHADAQPAQRLAASLGYLPLALSHARSYCWITNWNFDQYRENIAELIHKAPRGASYPATVFATFDLAIEKAIARCKEANELMSILALTAPDRFPLDLVSDNIMNEMKRGEAIAALCEVSLTFPGTFDDGSSYLSVHRLVQEVMRARLISRKAFSEAAGIATKLLAAAVAPRKGDPYDVRSWPACAKLLPHALIVLQYAPESGVESESTAILLNQVALYLNSRADFGAAERLMRRAVAVNEANECEDPSLAITLQNIAALLSDVGRYSEAISCIQRSISLDEMRQGLEHPDVASGLNILASLYTSQGLYDDAEPLHLRALAIREKALGREHRDVAFSLNNLAWLYNAQGHLDRAVSLQQRSLEIIEKTFGFEHPNVATSLNNLALFYRVEGRYQEAEPLQLRSLAILEKALGPEHPDVAGGLHNLADLYLAQGRYKEAELSQQRSLMIAERALGPDHPDVAMNLNNLAELYGRLGRYQDGARLHRRALEIREKALGPEHPDVAASLSNLAALYLAQSRYEEAEPLQQRSLAVTEKAVGPEHPQLATVLFVMATLYRAQDRYDEAEPLFKRALAIREKAFGPEHPDVATALFGMAMQYREQRRYEEAEPLFKRTLAIRETALGLEHPDVALVCLSMATQYRMRGRYDEAEWLFKRTLAIEEKALGPDHPEVATTLFGTAMLYRAQNRYDDAASLLRRALAIREKELGTDHPATRRILDILANAEVETR